MFLFDTKRAAGLDPALASSAVNLEQSGAAVPPAGSGGDPLRGGQHLPTRSFGKGVFPFLWHLAVNEVCNMHLQPACWGAALGVFLLPDCCPVYLGTAPAAAQITGLKGCSSSAATSPACLWLSF